MSGPANALHDFRNSSGAVLVFVALLLPVLIGFGGLIVDVGNWFAHKRHLQIQADAGALAGAGAMTIPCLPLPVIKATTDYSSVQMQGSAYTLGLGPSYNPQIGGTSGANLKGKINSQTYYPSRATPLDDTVPAGDLDPCAAKMIDVKLTETDLPWFLKAAHVDFIDAHARIEIKKKVSSSHDLPIGVPDPGPKKAKAIFVDESNGSVVGQAELFNTGVSGGLSIWSNASPAPVIPLNVNAADIGVRIVLSQNGAGSLTCGATLVDCYGAGTSSAIVAGQPGLVHIRGYTSPPGGTATAPKAGNVELLGVSCENGYFTATATASPCTVNVSATVDFGAEPLGTSRVLALRTGANANTAVELIAPATSTGSWTGGAIGVTRGEGAVGVTLRWQTGCPANRTQSCPHPAAEGSLGTVQRTFAGSEALDVSGPIKLLQLFDDTGASVHTNSFPACATSTCTHNLVVKLGLKPALAPAASVLDAPTVMKVAGGGSQNQALDCDPAVSNYRDELATGCAPGYALNDTTPCPANSSTLFATPNPPDWKCVAVSTGATVGQVTQGMNLRVLGATNPGACTAPNHWALYGTTGLPDGDPRLIEVFLTPFGAFNGSGGNTVPVIGFANFYVTGWDGGACQGSGDDAAGQGSIVGHYVTAIDKLGKGGGGTQFCDFTTLGACVAEFTR